MPTWRTHFLCKILKLKHLYVLDQVRGFVQGKVPEIFHPKNLIIGDFQKKKKIKRNVCFIPMKISQSFLGCKGGLKFWWLPWFPVVFLPRLNISFPSRPSLQRRSIYRKSLTDIFYFVIFQVRFLDVRNNRLSRLSNLTLSGLQQAEVVDLSLNRITSVQPEAFSGFHHIRELDLSFNKLRTIKSGAFRGCLTLKTLKMRSAGVQFIEAHGLDDFVALVELDLRYGKKPVMEFQLLSYKFK